MRPGVLITLLALLSGGGVALSGCTAGSSAKPAGPACAADRVPAVSPSGQPVAWGVPRSVPTTTGQVSAAVTGVHDPVALPPASSLVSKGCRWIGVDLWLTAGPDPANADLSHTASVVSADGAAYRPSPLGPTGRNGIGNLDLVGGDNRRGTLIFEVPATARIRYLAIGPSLRVDLAGPAPTGGPGAPDVSAGPAPTGGPGAPDVSAGTPAPLPPYAPGNWPGPGTPQTVDRLSGEKIEITPLRVHEDAPPDRTLRDGYRLYAVQLRMRVTGSQPWPLNPDHLATIVDDTGAQWLTAFATSTETPGFDPLQDQPGAEQTAWVAFEIPRTARPVALMLSSYPGRIWPWRL